MAKRKRRPAKAPYRPKPQASQSDRLALLAAELGTAAVQTLQEEYDFSPEESDRFLGLMLERARQNRAGMQLSQAQLAARRVGVAVEKLKGLVG